MSESVRYILSKKIARGGMAEIFLGKQVGQDGFQRLCAIKRILPHYAQESEFIEMFRDEAHICKRLQHANIVRVEGFEEVEGSYAIIMEYVDGADLRTLLATCEKVKEKLPVSAAVFLIAEAARGLHYAHTKIDEVTNRPLDIVHRDISPQNLLLSYEGEVKITDFGIADAENKVTETKPGIVKGKYSYMSPEQISGKNVDAKTDIFALSVVLWEMLAMKRLFQGDSEVETITLVRNCRVPFLLSSVNKEVDYELDSIIAKGLMKDPKRRFETAEVFEKELRRYLNKKYPEFTAADLGNFMKKVLSHKRNETQTDIKRVLTDTNLRIFSRTQSGASSISFIDRGDSNIRLTANTVPKNLPLPPGSSVPAPIAQTSTVPQTMPPKSLYSTPSHPVSGAPQAINLSKPASKEQSAIRLQSAAGGTNSAGARGPTGNPNISSKISISESPKKQKPAFDGPENYTDIGAAMTGIYPSRMKSPVAMVAILMLLVAAGGFGLFKGGVFMAKEQTQLVIAAHPQSVKLTLDGQKLKGGDYIKTPIVLQELTPGKHIVVASRQGHSDGKYAFKIRSGETAQNMVILKPKSKFASVKIFTSNKKRKVSVDIEDGLYEGTVPRKLDDLVYGETYQMKIYRSASDKKSYFSCKFSPKSFDARDPFKVIIDVENGKCTTKEPPAIEAAH